MANIVAPRGFSPKRHINGSPYNGQHQLFLIPASDATAVFVGDVVKTQGAAAAAGTIVNGVNCEGIQQCIKVATGATGQDILGVVVGFYPDVTNLTNRYRLASTNRLAMVSTDVTIIYEVQEDAVTSVIAPADVGLTFTFNVGTGVTATGQSNSTVISNTKTNAATAPLKLVGLVKRPDNAFNTGGAGTDPSKLEVLFNTGLFMPNVAGA